MAIRWGLAVDTVLQATSQMQPMMSQYPLAYALSKPREIAIVGDPDSADTQALLNVVSDGCRPFQVVALGVPDAQPPAVPLQQDRGLVEGHGAAYVCRDSACQAPVTEVEALQALLKLREATRVPR